MKEFIGEDYPFVYKVYSNGTKWNTIQGVTVQFT